METIIRYLKKVALENYIFNLTVSLIIIVVSLILCMSTDFGNVLLGFGILYFLVFILLYMRKMAVFKVFFKEEKEKTVPEYKTIDSSVFTEQEVYAYSLDQLVKMKYADIKSMNHLDNIWEKTRPGYKGNHKIILKDDCNTIQIRVKDEAIADMIMNFITTKNSHITLMNGPQRKKDIHLSELDCWQVSGRF